MANGEFGLYLIAESVRQERERKRLLSPTPTYTLNELKQLTGEYCKSRLVGVVDESTLERELTFSLFLAWLAKREQGEVNNG